MGSISFYLSCCTLRVGRHGHSEDTYFRGTEDVSARDGGGADRNSGHEKRGGVSGAFGDGARGQRADADEQIVERCEDTDRGAALVLGSLAQNVGRDRRPRKRKAEPQERRRRERGGGGLAIGGR